MIGDIPYKKDGVTPDLPQSKYQPSNEIKAFCFRVKKDYTTGYGINHREFTEFNDRNLLDVISDNQKKFNSYVEPQSDDPDEAWRWPGVRPITRNKIISIAAHITATIIYPNVFAQNDADEEDKDSANIMRNLIKWNIKNSDYEISFLFGVIAGLVNPVSYLQAEFAEVMQSIKERQENGEITLKEVVDEVLSGLKTYNVPPDEILIANAYEYDLQKQRFLIRRRFVDYDDLRALHGKHPNFDYVQPGIKTLYSEADSMFYDQVDEELQTLGEEVRYYNRREDTEVIFVNGIYMGDDNVNNNPIKHRDNKNRPKYNYVKFGYEPIDEKRFYFYKSAVDKLASDQDLIDVMWRMVIDGTFLAVMPALAVSGSDERIPSSIIMPGAVTNFDQETKVTQISPGSNLVAGFNATREIENSMIQSSQSPISAGIPEKGVRGGKGGTTAYEIAKTEQNARTQLDLFGKMVAKMVTEYGELMVDLIIHHQTVGEVEEILGGSIRMKFRSFLLPEEIEGGKKITTKIRFADELVGTVLTEEQSKKIGYKIMKEEGGYDADTRIYRVNPEKFSRLKFSMVVNADSFLPKNEEFEKIIKLEAYDRMISSPFVNQEAITRDFLVEPLAKGESDKYMRKNVEKILPQLMAGAPGVTKKGKAAPPDKKALAGILEE